jgi:TPR repeat protein
VPPQFTFIRTTTESQEEITPPQFPGDPFPPAQQPKKRSRSKSLFRKNSHSGLPKEHRSLGEKLHLSRGGSRSASASSVNLPQGLPDEPETAKDQHGEAQWEARATLLAKANSISRSSSPMVRGQNYHGVSDAPSDDHIQEAIRLHEEGDLARSTEMFGRLANPNGANNALSQVLYGLALRHGWGCAKNEEKAITYLSMAATNSADIETQALNSGSKKGGAAKGELTIAIFELANCFRNGWGVNRDPVAAKQYYETAANMGDTDAMNEISWCYIEGFGCKKDKVSLFQYSKSLTYVLTLSPYSSKPPNIFAWLKKKERRLLAIHGTYQVILSA